MGNLCIGDAEPQHRKLRVAEVPYESGFIFLGAKGEANWMSMYSNWELMIKKLIYETKLVRKTHCLVFFELWQLCFV